MNLKLLKTLLRHRLPTTTILLIGVAGWAALFAYWRPTPFDVEWGRLLLMLAPLVLVPMALAKVSVPLSWLQLTLWWEVDKQLTLPAAVLLGVAQVDEPGWRAAALATPWVLVTALLAWIGLQRGRDHLRGPVHELCLDAALVYLPVGAAWAFADRLGYRPLDFDPVIVLLTGIHFHYAGFALPVVAGLVLRENKGRLANVVGVGVIAGVPLVAAGITLAHLNLGTGVEIASAWVLAAAAAVVAVYQMRLAFRVTVSRRVQLLWLASATSLLASMALAALYGSRFVLPVGWLDIPWMRALHGTANALGFALCGVAGWWLRR